MTTLLVAALAVIVLQSGGAPGNPYTLRWKWNGHAVRVQDFRDTAFTGRTILSQKLCTWRIGRRHASDRRTRRYSDHGYAVLSCAPTPSYDRDHRRLRHPC